MRPSDIARSQGNPSKAAKVLGWRPSYGMRDVVRMMLRAELHTDGEANTV
jgi:GDPmannose 4,6-dehydratase